ncbi:MAG: hypothetical protein AB1488_06065 [Nitrospirota bacterium]
MAIINKIGYNKNKWYFIPHELTYPEREDEVKGKGISSDELSGYIKDIKARKILIGLEDKVAELEKKLEHYKEVFRHQMGF